MTTKEQIQSVRTEIRETRQEMKVAGIRRISCFNGGHSADSYRINARMFQLETRLKDLQRAQA